MIENALILAAGKGTRMWPLTEDIPKPLLPISGIPIIKRQIDELKKVGVKKLYILIGYQMNEISDYIDKTETTLAIWSNLSDAILTQERSLSNWSMILLIC